MGNIIGTLVICCLVVAMLGIILMLTFKGLDRLNEWLFLKWSSPTLCISLYVLGLWLLAGVAFVTLFELGVLLNESWRPDRRLWDFAP